MENLLKKTEKELIQLLVEKREALRILRFSMSGGQVKNFKEGKNLKKDIARIMTLLNK